MINYTFGNSYFRNIDIGNEREWMVSNGIGGYGGHTIAGGGNRLYHGYLIASKRPPVERVQVLTRTQEEVIFDSGNTYDLTSQTYLNWYKDGHKHLVEFKYDGLPTYRYQTEDVCINKTICMNYGSNTVVICYEVKTCVEGVNLKVIPLFTYKQPGESCSKSMLNFDVLQNGRRLQLIPQADKNVTIDFVASEGKFYDRALLPMNITTPDYRYEENHFYQFENENGFMGVDSHYTPYEIQIEVPANTSKKFYFTCSIDGETDLNGFQVTKMERERLKKLIEKAEAKDDVTVALTLSADHFIVDRASTGYKTILAGYPWFNDWGRDTMIALHGLTLSTNRYDDAKSILRSFAMYIKNGLMPNNFPDTDTEPGYNTVDGALWYFYAVDQYVKHSGDYQFVKEELYEHLKSIILWYQKGTDYHIKMDVDGLIIAGDGTMQLTWMDVKVDDWVVTPRNGKPVEINALWYNALMVITDLSHRFNQPALDYEQLTDKVKKSFVDKFWNENKQCLYDTVDEIDEKVRCNQIWAVSLPYTMLDEARSKKVVEKVYKDLYTPYGLRSLAVYEEGFVPVYKGKLIDRDAAYHMGTTWAYPMGAFISAYCKVNQYSKNAVKEAYDMCNLFVQHLEDGCVNGIAEIFDGLVANKGRGCYNQAWSVGELLRSYTEDVIPYMD